MGLLSSRDVRGLLQAHGLAPSRRLGQHFVTDQNTVRKVVRQAEVEADDHVVEIGPGLGSLTLALRQAGARVTAVEVDAGLVRVLGEVVGDDQDVTVVHADALHVDLGALAGPSGPAVLVANLPYNVATALVLRALQSERFARLLVMVQREVGERWAAPPGTPRAGAPSVKIAAYATCEIAGAISRAAFWPVPQVDSVTVRLRPRRWPFPVGRGPVLDLAEQGFRQRRKQLRNALSGPGRAPATIVAALRQAGLPEGARAEELTLGQWADLASRMPTTG